MNKKILLVEGSGFIDHNLALAIKFLGLYDYEFSKKNFKTVLKYLDILEFEFEEIVNKHRNNEIWTTKDNYWQLINKI